MACIPGIECFLAGHVPANQHVLLVTLHTIWLCEHNRIATELKAMNSHWNDERLFQETRKIIGAMIQKITYYEYVPKLLGQMGFDQMVGEYSGYNPDSDASILNSFTTAAFRFGHSSIQSTFARLGPKYEVEEPLDAAQGLFAFGAFQESGGTDKLLRGMLTQPM